MLEFFRKYQRYFFIVITIVVIISFSFFGTYSTLGSNSWREQLAFKAINGDEITRSEVEDLAHFIRTDNTDKLLLRGMWGPNFLNDGVIQKDFLQTGLGYQLAAAYAGEISPELQERLAKEQKYILYTHPQAPFLSVENAWSYFLPEMKSFYQGLVKATNATDQVALNNRINLYLAERQLPASSLQQILHYQEQQFQWIKPDRELDRKDLSLFGYHTVEDWMGPTYIRLVSEFIINTAIIAKQQGYVVTDSEAMADLIRQTQISFKENQNSPYLGVASPTEYFNEQLRRLNMDRAEAVRIWKQVLLFRRFFQDTASSALVDTLANKNFSALSNKTANVDFYQLPEGLHLATFDDLQKFEVYLNAVAKMNKNDLLSLPQQYLSVLEVSKMYPELVQKRYLLDIAQVNAKTLQAKISLKDLWSWEADEKNWEKLVKQFPDLALKEATTKEKRFETLEELDKVTRSKVDGFAKKALLESNPQWIKELLAQAPYKKEELGIRLSGGAGSIKGISTKEKSQELMSYLDKASLGEDPAVESSLYVYTPDQQNFYRIKVLEKAPDLEILTFAEAQRDGTLKKVQDRVLEKYYQSTREQNPLAYQKENKEWKSFDSVKELVAQNYFENILAALQPLQKTLFPSEKEMKTFSKDQAATLRFYKYVKEIQEKLQKDSSLANQWIIDANSDKIMNEQVTQKTSLADQWKLKRESVVVNRQVQKEGIDPQEAFSITIGGWSKIIIPANGDLSFYQVEKSGIENSKVESVAADLTYRNQQVLGNEVQQVLMERVLADIKKNDAISLKYLQKNTQENIDIQTAQNSE